jgi:hypothetical protein
MKQNQSALRAKSNFFKLTKKNQSGQVAVFVALIFQVIFIFFALLINIGLLIHHKINLQHSTDMAAYYGAMKQAESMNAIAHINFQLRQNWKLFTWRYRIFGTFGFTKTAGSSGGSSSDLDFPFESNVSVNPNKWDYNGSAGQFGTNVGSAFVNGPQVPGNATAPGAPPVLSCTNIAQTNSNYTLPGGGAIGPHDTPFFCVGHAGIGGWPSGETNCQFQCSTFVFANGIDALPVLNSTYNTIGANMASSVAKTLEQVNKNRESLCKKLGPVGASVLARFMIGYIMEASSRSQTLAMLAANLSQDADRFVDLDGAKVIDGAKRTFENNLTGANFSGITDSSFKTYNGLSNSECRFRTGKDSAKEFLKKIEFNYLQLFIHNCVWGSPATGENYKPESIITETGLNSVFNEVPAAAKEAILSLYAQGGDKFSVGYEKNPNCVEYYAVRTSTEPNIPFLPLSKIKLNALSIAKPFGGSIGPSYGDQWPKSNSKSVFNDAPDPTGAETRIDKALPIREFKPGLSITQTIYAQPNFSLFVGDKLGLRNLDYIAAFHSMLAARDVAGGPTNTTGVLSQDNPNAWPAFTNWNGLDDSTNMQQYDSLAASQPQTAAGIRQIEIAAIAPNQFDIAYYSIEPDFYNNYLKKIVKNFDVIKNAAGLGGVLTKNTVRADFGADDIEPENDSIKSSPLNLKTFSVKDQILAKNQLLSVNIANPPSYNPRGADDKSKYMDILNFLVRSPTSLLSAWTFKRFDEYDPTNNFPNAKVDKTLNTMSFGQCFDTWSNTEAILSSPVDANNFRTPPEHKNELPNVPGNCVTGGRTGYSVKIISPSMVNISNTKIENPIDSSFISF